MDRQRTESSREGKVKNTEDILQDLGVKAERENDKRGEREEWIKEL